MRLLFILFTVLLSWNSYADAWDNLTKEEAENVIEYLKVNPYIFDYCDCCDHEGEYATTIEFLKVIDARIVTCEWDNEFYTVKATVEVIAHVPYTENGPDIKRIERLREKDSEVTIYMNYTWGLDLKTKKAAPFFDLVTYHYEHNRGACKEPFEFPHPRALKKTWNDKEYKKWYRQNVK